MIKNNFKVGNTILLEGNRPYFSWYYNAIKNGDRIPSIVDIDLISFEKVQSYLKENGFLKYYSYRDLYNRTLYYNKIVGGDLIVCELSVSNNVINPNHLFNDDSEVELYKDKACYVRVGGLYNFEYIDKVVKDINSFKAEKKNKSKVNFVVKHGASLSLQSFKINKIDLDLSLNYNDDFIPVHKKILNSLKIESKSGLMFLHGKHGTGKTSYLRYLMGMIDKKVIYLSPDMVDSISNPNFLIFLMEHRNSVLIIEDSENVIRTRDDDMSSKQGISNLLNLSDGIMGDCLNMQIICTFNTNLENIDPALLRKGRLIAKYEFKELSLDKTRRLADKLGIKKDINEGMTLGDIYNLNDDNFCSEKTKKIIGF